MTPRLAPVVGVVLAGGKSTRLGHDKACIELDGRDMLVRTADLLGQVVPEVWVVGRDAADHDLDLPWLMDDVPGRGPAGGIMTAMRRIQRPCLVLSCDLPFIGRQTLERLIMARMAAHTMPLMTTFSQVETGYIESLVAVYDPAALPRLETAVARNLNKLSLIFPRETRLEVPYTQDEALPFFNINYPADLALLREMHQARSGRRKEQACPART